MIYIYLILAISMICKYIIRNCSFCETNYREFRVQLDLGDMILSSIFVLEIFGLVSIGEMLNVNLKNFLRMTLAVISIISINKTSFKIFMRYLKDFGGNLKLSAGGVHHIIKGYQRVKFVALAFITAASGPFLEELIFRLGLTHILGKVLCGNFPLLIQALLFGLIHGLPMYIGGANIKAALTCFLTTFVDGLILGYVFINSGVIASWLCHWCVNFISAVTYEINKSVVE